LKDLSFSECVGTAWRNGGLFLQRRPFLVLLALAVLLVAGLTPLALANTVYSGIDRALLSLTASTVRLVVMVALPIQVMQYALEAEHGNPRPMFGKEFWRYLGLCLAFGFTILLLGIIPLAIGLLLARGHSSRSLLSLAWCVIMMCLVVFISIRFSLLFCHVATGHKARWRACWSDTRGYFWRIFVSHFLTGLPIQVLVIALIAIAYFLIPVANRPLLPWISAIGFALTIPVSLVFGSACSCWLYTRLANTLLEPHA
jgi:hypothetical protein